MNLTTRLSALLLAFLAMWLGPTQALATCPTSEAILDELTCSSSVSTVISTSSSSTLGGSCSGLDCYTCGTPYYFLSQGDYEDVYEFTCQATGSVTLEIGGLDCDLDIYILDSTCDPYFGCEDGSTEAGTADDSVTFSCTAGDTYYVVIEGYGFSLSSGDSGYCGSGDGSYTLDFDISAGTGCPEDCTDGTDNDFDGDIDCDDSDCASEPICACDTDGDGYDAVSCGGLDCDDTDASINPLASEVCDGIDNDCDGDIDADDSDAVGLTTYYPDADGDSYGDSSGGTDECSAPSGYTTDDTDCDDTDASVNPGATEVCDSIDNDCDGSIDEGLTTTYFPDADGDGYGDSSGGTDECSAPSGYTTDSSDCNDANASINPAASEVCDGVDNDCDGYIDAADSSVTGLTTYYADTDFDGYGDPTSSTQDCSAPSGYTVNATDCDDSVYAINPAATEICDGVDNDCDGAIDDADPSVTGQATWYVDTDGDSYGASTTSTDACSQPSGYVASSTDCDDTNAAIHPAATEVCDGFDNDCDGAIDDADSSVTGLTTYYADADGDAYGNASVTSDACSTPSGYTSNATDCDDTDASVNPGATEVCDYVDNDCDGDVDEGLTTTFYADTDGDAYGDLSTTTDDCSAPSGYVSDSTDCDDTDSAIHPGATEVCDSEDNDCDGDVDEGLTTTYYADSDGDSYGDLGSTTDDCSAPSGYVSDSTDCDDTDSAIHPGATEVCDSVDNDCDGSIDEGVTITFYADADGDAYGDATSTTDDCTEPSGYVSDDTDCDDTDATVYPTAPEVAYDGIDQDCDGDDLCDVDGDGFDYDGGTCAGTDCDDTDADVGPGSSEVADGVDEDCDGTVDEGTEWYDDDGDGFTEDGGDCDDTDADVAPSMVEDCDGIDDDCDGTIDEETDCYDDDGDGFTEDDGDCNDGDADVNPDMVEVDDNGIDDDCDGSVDGGVYDPDGDGYTEDAGDCEPEHEDSYPGAPELPDGIDNDCDGTIDEGTTAYDDDGDGFTEDDGDCNDLDPDTHPGAEEELDGQDDDCDGEVDNGTDASDDDGDGFSEEAGDCDDDDPDVYPGAPESENGIDDDCDGDTDEDETDADMDGVSTADGDCDDDNPWASPDGVEVCDGIDNDCDGDIDEGCELAGDDGLDKGGCSCAATQATATFALLLPLAFVAFRRRAA